MSQDSRLRRHERRAVAAEIRVHDARDTSVGEISFDALDLSAGGAFLKSDLLLGEGEQLDVSFHLPGREAAMTTRARVVWTARRPEMRGAAGMGIEFTSLEPADRDALAAFVKDRPNGQR